MNIKTYLKYKEIPFLCRISLLHSHLNSRNCDIICCYLITSSLPGSRSNRGEDAQNHVTDEGWLMLTSPLKQYGIFEKAALLCVSACNRGVTPSSCPVCRLKQKHAGNEKKMLLSSLNLYILEWLGGVRPEGMKTEFCLGQVLLPSVVRIHFSFLFLESGDPVALLPV